MQNVHAFIIIHNMILKSRHGGHENEMFMHAIQAVDYCMFVDEEGNEKTFSWILRNSAEATSGLVTDSQCAYLLGLREIQIVENAQHFGLNQDLMEHTWTTWGLRSADLE